MIHTNRTVTVGNQESIIDSPIILYRGDREVEVEFTLNGNKFSFTNEGNVIKSTNATHGQLVINTPSGENMFSEVTECHDGRVVFVITKEMIDELIEIGFYSFQIRLFDKSQVSRVTIPPVYQGIDIRTPIAAEDETDIVDIGLVGYSIVRKDEPEDLSTFLPSGNYNKTNWEPKDIISGHKLNKIEDAIYTINENMEATDLALLNRLESINQNFNRQLIDFTNQTDAEIENFERNIDNQFERLKVDTNAAMTQHKNEVADELDSLNDRFNEQFNPKKMDGIAFSVKSDFMGTLETHINKIKEYGATGQMVVFASVPNTASVDLQANTSEVMDRAFEYVRDADLEISLMKVHLVCNFADGTESNRTAIIPNEGDEEIFFSNYENILRYYLNYCMTNNIDKLCIANENSKLVKSERCYQHWVLLINHLKEAYPSVSLSYSMNSQDITYFRIAKENNVPNILNFLDFLSFNLYPKISNFTNFTYVEPDEVYMQTLYSTKVINNLQKYHELYQKDMIISEIGCTHTVSSLNKPEDNTGNTDARVQGVYYRIVLNSIAKADFIKGTYIWHTSEPFSFYGTDGEIVLQNHFGGVE